jgi:hypothetical protein
MEKSIQSWAYDYLNEGDLCLRRQRGHPVIESLLAGERAGIDVAGMVRDALSDMSTCHRLTSQYQSVRQGLFLRAIVILLMVCSVRLILLTLTPDISWQDWIDIDRVAWITMFLILVCLLFVLYRYDQTQGTLSRSRIFLHSWFCCYVTLSPDALGNLGMRAKLRAAKTAEIRFGADSLHMRRRIYMDALGEHLTSLRRDLERLPLAAMGLEIFLFTIGSAGLLAVPFIAWLETRSGGM